MPRVMVYTLMEATLLPRRESSNMIASVSSDCRVSSRHSCQLVQAFPPRLVPTVLLIKMILVAIFFKSDLRLRGQHLLLPHSFWRSWIYSSDPTKRLCRNHTAPREDESKELLLEPLVCSYHPEKGNGCPKRRPTLVISSRFSIPRVPLHWRRYLGARASITAKQLVLDLIYAIYWYETLSCLAYHL